MTRISDRAKGISMAISAAMLWGLGASMIRQISASGVSQAVQIAARALIIAMLLGAYLVLKGGASALRVSGRTMRAYLAISFWSIILNMGGYTVAVSYMTLPQAVLIHYAFPLVTMTYELITAKDRPSAGQMICGAMIIVGLAVAFASRGSFEEISMIGLIGAVASVFGCAGQNIMTRSMHERPDSSTMKQMFWTHLFGGIILALLVTPTIGWGDISALTPRVMLMMLYPILVNGIAAFGLAFSALKYIPAGLMGIILSFEIVTTLAFMTMLSGVLPSLREAAGGAIIMAAIAISARSR